MIIIFTKKSVFRQKKKYIVKSTFYSESTTVNKLSKYLNLINKKIKKKSKVSSLYFYILSITFSNVLNNISIIIKKKKKIIVTIGRLLNIFFNNDVVPQLIRNLNLRVPTIFFYNFDPPSNYYSNASPDLIIILSSHICIVNIMCITDYTVRLSC